MAIKTSINCVHCGRLFQVTLPTNGNGSGSCTGQCSPGCMKVTRIEYKNGSVVRTSKG